MAFKKGRSGNPSGRPKETEQDKAVKVLSKETWNDLSQKMMTCTKQDLEDLLNGPKVLAYEAEIFIRHMLALGEEPDWNAYDKYLNRRIGKVIDRVEHTGQQEMIVYGVDGSRIEFKERKEDIEQ